MIHPSNSGRVQKGNNAVAVIGDLYLELNLKVSDTLDY